MGERKQSFFRALLAQIVGSASPVDGGYIFDLHGRWRYDAPRGNTKPIERQPAGVTEVLCEARL